MVALDPTIGSEQAETRPCVVVQRDSANRSGRTTIVVPFTDAANSVTSIIAPRFDKGDGGLIKASVALCHQVRAVDRIRLRTRLGALGTDALRTLGIGLNIILDLEIGSCAP